MVTYHTVIIGAGASGLFCAGSFNTPKLILDHNQIPGVKLGITGGGKCNFTNRLLTPNHYVSQRKHSCKSALATFKPDDFIHLLDENNISYEERDHGKLFAKNAQEIVRLLIKRAQKANTDFSLNTQVLNIEQNAGEFTLRTSGGTLYAQRVVLATGGLSYPVLGASSWGIQMARQLGLAIVEQHPALCGLTFPKPIRPLCKELAGNSTPVLVKTDKFTCLDQLLFTHEGISGPAILSASLHWQEPHSVFLNFLPNTDLRQLLAQHKQQNKKISSVVKLPGKMASVLLGELDQPLANMPKNTLEAAIKRLSAFEFVPAGVSGYTKAEVTAGGIDTAEVNPVTFEVKKIPGLYIIGELLDVTGELGGFNLHWAWASGYCAAQDLAKKF